MTQDAASAVRTFAYAVASGPVALLIAPGNSKYGDTSIDDAVARDLCFAVEQRQDLVVIDADNEAANTFLDHAADVLRAAGCTPVITSSGREGHRHLFALCAQAELRSQLKRSSPGGDVLRTGPIRPPLARHRIAGRSELITPATEASALGALLGGVTGVYLGPPRKLGALAHEAMTLAPEACHPPYASRSEAVMGGAVGYVNAGRGFEEYCAAVLAPTCPSGAHLREKHDPRARAWHTWSKALRYAASRPVVGNKAAVRERLQELRRRHLLLGWPGLAGPTDAAAMCVIVDIALKPGTLTPNVSVRQLAERANIDAGTAWLSLQRLEERGLLAVAQHTHAYGREIRLNTHDYQTSSTSTLTTGGVRTDAWISMVRHDAFRQRALGKLAWLICAVLASIGPSSRTELRDAVGQSETSMDRALRRLRQAALVRVDGSRLSVVQPELHHLDAVALAHGELGAAAAQAERFDSQRMAYRTRGVA